MYILYLDDSGSVNNPDEDYLVLGGVSIFERQIYFISKKLDEIAEKISPNDPNSIEFHASDIFNGHGAPWNKMPKGDRKKIIQEVLDVFLKDSKSTSAFACAVHKKSYPGFDPMELAFEDLCSRFDMQLSRQELGEQKQRGLIVIDKTSSETSLQKLMNQFKITGTYYRKLKTMTDVPFFVDSKSSRLIQLADHVAYAVFRYYQRNDTTFFNSIVNKFDSHENVIHGLCHKQTYIRNCICPACMTRKLAAL